MPLLARVPWSALGVSKAFKPNGLVERASGGGVEMRSARVESRKVRAMATTLARRIGIFLVLWLGVAAAAQADFNGYHDVGNCSVVAGWAWDSGQPTTSVSVDIYVDGALAGLSRPLASARICSMPVSAMGITASASRRPERRSTARRTPSRSSTQARRRTSTIRPSR